MKNRLKLIVDPNPILRTVSDDFLLADIDNTDTKQLVAEMKRSIVLEHGVGLAAPQIGVNKRLIVVETKTGIKAYFNPKIKTKSFKMIEFEEGCLSVPGIWGVVDRHRSVVVEVISETGHPEEISASGLISVIFQHEIDHLDGILFIDKVKRYLKSSDSII